MHVKNTIRIIAAVAVFLAASESYPQALPPPFSLKLDVSNGNAMARTILPMEVDLTNTTTKEIAIEICNGMSVECDFEIVVRDSRGNSLPAAYNGAAQVFSTGLMGIHPGETKKFYSELTKLFDLSRPGTYTVQVRISGSNMYIDAHTSQAVAESNMVTITVVHPCKVPASQLQRIRCADFERQEADERLARVYNKALQYIADASASAQMAHDQARIDYEKKATMGLQQAQGAWGFYRDVQCKAAGPQDEGSSRAAEFWAQCLKALANQRIDTLKSIYEDADRKLE
jgi:uncharacterized protein YecT (DUF1311 family)